jgi:hypothetical protein
MHFEISIATDSQKKRIQKIIQLFQLLNLTELRHLRDLVESELNRALSFKKLTRRGDISI